MKIAFILTSLNNSGPIIVAQDLVKELLNKGHECNVFYFKERGTLSFDCPTKKISYLSSFNFNSFDIIHCHGLQPDLFVMFRKPLFCKTPIVTTLHSYLFLDHYYQYGKYLYKLTASLVLAATIRDDKIITLSKDALLYYKTYLPKKKLTYAYNTRTCKTSDFLNEELKMKIISFKRNSFLIGSNCAITDRKNLNVIIDALVELPQFKFCIVGDGPGKKDLEERCQVLGLEDRVLFIGRQPEAHRFLSLYDIFAIPSKSEGFPLAMLEAAIYKKAILGSNLPVFKEIFDDSEIVTFDLDHPEEVAPALKKLSENLLNYGENAYNRYKTYYSPECFVNRHLEIYKEVIDSKHR